MGAGVGGRNMTKLGRILLLFFRAGGQEKEGGQVNLLQLLIPHRFKIETNSNKHSAFCVV